MEITIKEATGRARCRNCGDYIIRGEKCIAWDYGFRGHSGIHYCHLECVGETGVTITSRPEATQDMDKANEDIVEDAVDFAMEHAELMREGN